MSAKFANPAQGKHVRPGDLVCYNPPTSILRRGKNGRCAKYVENKHTQKLLAYDANGALTSPSEDCILRRGDMLLYVEFNNRSIENIVFFKERTWIVAVPTSGHGSEWKYTYPCRSRLIYSQTWHVV